MWTTCPGLYVKRSGRDSNLRPLGCPNHYATQLTVQSVEIRNYLPDVDGTCLPQTRDWRWNLCTTHQITTLHICYSLRCIQKCVEFMKITTASTSSNQPQTDLHLMTNYTAFRNKQQHLMSAKAINKSPKGTALYNVTLKGIYLLWLWHYHTVVLQGIYLLWLWHYHCVVLQGVYLLWLWHYHRVVLQCIYLLWLWHYQVTYFFSQKSRIKVVNVSWTLVTPTADVTSECDDDADSSASVPRIILNWTVNNTIQLN